jgi:hypothetical protein
MNPEKNSNKLRLQFERELGILMGMGGNYLEEYVRWLEHKIEVLLDVISANSIKDNNLE